MWAGNRVTFAEFTRLHDVGITLKERDSPRHELFNDSASPVDEMLNSVEPDRSPCAHWYVALDIEGAIHA